ncbi:MAG: leucyl aminopeptidase, partial [Ktedonobacterales bacterium]
MDLRVSTSDVRQFDGDAVVVGVFAHDPELKGPAAALDEALGGVLSQLRTNGEISGTAGEVTVLHTLGKIGPARIAVLGLGPHEVISTNRIGSSAAIACRTLRKAGSKHVGLAFGWAESGINPTQLARSAAEGAILGLYSFTKYQAISSGDGENSGTPGTTSTARKAIESLTILAPGLESAESALRAAVLRGQILAESTNYARDLGNEPPNILTPNEFAERARHMAGEVGLDCEVYGPDWMRQENMGALLGVAQGSAQEPRFIVLKYRGGSADMPGPAFIGKGITFDSGGISIKPAEGMQAMKMDMCGAASVIGAMRAIALVKPSINVTGIVPTTENMPDGGAYRPGDILRASNGTTIEIVNTDAEGRLILADALCYAVRHDYAPLVDIATLTGAIVISLGHVRAGLFSNDQGLQQSIVSASETAGERFWPMPMDPEYEELIQSEVADVRQTGVRWGGAIAAAKVLSRFVDRQPWAHLDIAGMSDLERKGSHTDAGATGFGVR